MSTPKITLTLLGATGSGKTAFLLGMYMTLHAGVHGYNMLTQDRDDHFDLREAWKLLRTQGELPPPNDVKPIQHHFVFNHEFDPLLHLDVLDFRGNAALERARTAGANADVSLLRDRLRTSDSIYIVLDGEQVGQWINRGCRPETTDWADDINYFSSFVGEAVQTQRKAGRPGVSLVVLITKADRLPAITGLKKADAALRAADNMENLVKPAFYPGVSALICPVQIGDLGPTPSQLAVGTAHRVDPSKVDPRFLHMPVVFSLMHYLTEQVVLDTVRLGDTEARGSAAQAEAEQLRDAFLGFGSLFNSTRIKEATDRIDASKTSAESIKSALASARERAGQLMAELAGLPIIKDGKRL
jgi:hypothetical protein